VYIPGETRSNRTVTEPQVIQAAREGDADAFALLVGRYERTAYGHALALLGGREQAKDAVQDSFMAAYRAIRRFDPDRPFFPWFYVILRNRCRSMLRDRRHNEPLDEACLAVTPRNTGEEVEELRRALCKLPAEDREILLLKYIEGHRYKQIAEMLDVPVGTVTSRLHTARRRLAELLERHRKLEAGT
jgi:RNA polymerase sigma-70 factor (ECF subfamily)